MKHIRLRMVVVGVLALSPGVTTPGATAGSSVQQQAADDVTLPTRRAPRAPAVVEPPALPAAADTLAPMTLTVVTRRQTGSGGVRVNRQTVLRTADRTLVSLEGTQSEWLFERNAVDARRVSGYLIDHRTRRILRHDESDLRNGQQLRGWLDVLTLRFDPESLKVLKITSEQTTVRGTTFTRYLARERPVHGVAEVWWNDRVLLPLRVIVRDGPSVISSTVESFDEEVAPGKLAPPTTRFPNYRVMDVADARDHGPH